MHKKQLGNQINTYFNKGNKTYYFQLNSFNWIEDPTANLYSKLKRKFEEVFKDVKNKQAENLIIDLRFNGGGDVEVSGLLYSFIAQEKSGHAIFDRTVRSEFIYL
ncbi:S41 family peptidase [Pontimicrobium sp. MEBiC06410]